MLSIEALQSKSRPGLGGVGGLEASTSRSISRSVAKLLRPELRPADDHDDDDDDDDDDDNKDEEAAAATAKRGEEGVIERAGRDLAVSVQALYARLRRALMTTITPTGPTTTTTAVGANGGADCRHQQRDHRGIGIRMETEAAVDVVKESRRCRAVYE